MPFQPPTFNCVFQFWTGAHTPVGGPADVFDVPGQPYINARDWMRYRRAHNDNDFFPIILRLPVGVYTPVRGDIFEETAPGSEGFFLVQWVTRIHRNFPNEYIAVMSLKCDGGGNPLTTGPP